MSYYIVSTNGNGLVVRQVGDNDTTVYADREIATFDTLEEANQFADAHDDEYYEDPEERPSYSLGELTQKIVSAIEASCEESTDDEEVFFDVRWSEDRGLYVAYSEEASGDDVVVSRVDPNCPDVDAYASEIYAQENERINF